MVQKNANKSATSDIEPKSLDTCESDAAESSQSETKELVQDALERY